MKQLVNAGNILGCCATSGAYGFCNDVDLTHPTYGPGWMKTMEKDIEELETTTYKNRQSICIVTLNSNQKISADFLKARGWSGTPWIGRAKNSSYTTKVKIMWKCVTGEEYSDDKV